MVRLILADNLNYNLKPLVGILPPPLASLRSQFTASLHFVSLPNANKGGRNLEL